MRRKRLTKEALRKLEIELRRTFKQIRYAITTNDKGSGEQSKKPRRSKTKESNLEENRDGQDTGWTT